jgi:hypothetical protein
VGVERDEATVEVPGWIVEVANVLGDADAHAVHFPDVESILKEVDLLDENAVADALGLAILRNIAHFLRYGRSLFLTLENQASPDKWGVDVCHLDGTKPKKILLGEGGLVASARHFDAAMEKREEAHTGWIFPCGYIGVPLGVAQAK